ncbi:flagellin [Ruegeria marisrubri]|uniref:Flagellin n=1 Tax=Ruegeria marisrubri TaxID=1685379 RepID=A0A0X3TQ99_9RHOB|nr:flagellin [Ruegeria marisrubri]KUJ77904.1 flagellin [Ruegeria marisrubri]
MSSILTNNGAMVALQTLKSINKNLGVTQNEISTGKSVASAKDNAAVWAISKVMESDVKGFKGISDSLSLGESTVAVAQNGAETVADLLTQIKGKIVAAQEENVDRAKIQTDISALRDQINSVVGAAQFNGLNLLSNRDTTTGSGSIDVLSSLDRSSDGTVNVSHINVVKKDLGTQATDWTTGTAAAGGSGATIGGALDAASAVALTGAATPPTTTLDIESVAAGTGVQINISGAAGSVGAAFNDSARAVSYVARDGDTQADVANALAKAFNDRVSAAVEDGTLSSGTSLKAAVTVAASGVATITFTGETGTGNNVSLQAIETAGVTIGGGLEDLANIDVTTAAGAKSALTDIEGLIQTAIDSAASFGSARGRIETQSEFVSKLSDSLKSGIGAMVDADMEEASARLQALQTQQQLAVQSLSIANQAPQTILSLFR